MSADIPFSQFSFLALLSHWYQHWVKVALACFETCWNSVRKARRTNFWRKVRSQCGDAKNFARKGPAQNKSPDCLLALQRPRNRLSDLNSLGDIAVFKKMSADSPFFQLSFAVTLSHWYQDWIKVDLALFLAPFTWFRRHHVNIPWTGVQCYVI